MPYESKAQAAYFNIHRKELEGQGVDVDEWNKASRGKKLPKKKGEKHAFMVGYRETMKKAGFAEPSQQDRLLAILAQLQHHLDDAEVYGGQGMQLPAHLSIDDAEEGVEDLSQEILPPGKAQAVEEVAEKGDEEEKEKGVESPPGMAPDHSKEAVSPDEGSAEGAFELGLRHAFKKAGFTGYRMEAMVELARAHGMGEIKTAEDFCAAVVPFAAADAHEKRAEEEAHPFNKILALGLAKAHAKSAAMGMMSPPATPAGAAGAGGVKGPAGGSIPPVTPPAVSPMTNATATMGAAKAPAAATTGMTP